MAVNVNTKRSGREPAPNSMMLRRTLFLLIVCGIVAFLVLAIRLFQLQIIDHGFYESLAIEQQVRDNVVTASRGTIYDANGKILAMSASAETIFISPKEILMYDIKDPGEEGYTGMTQEFIAQGLAEILGIDAASIMEKMAKTESMHQTLARKVEPEVSEKVREFKNENKIKGVFIIEDTKRYYPYSSLASHVLGFVNADSDGALGLELVYNDALKGVNGRVVRAKNAVGTDMLFTSFEEYYDAKNGYDMYTTIDSTIQYYMEKYLKQGVTDYDAQGGGAAIAMNVKTGAIMGMVSVGDFDLNNYQIVSDEDQAKIDEATDEDVKSTMLRAAQDKQWRNKAINDTYEPGSTFKIMTLAMALNEGIVKPTDAFYCGGTVEVTGREDPVNCWKHGGHGSQTLGQTLANSCNVAYVDIGQDIGAETFYKYAEAFGFFDSKTDETAPLSGKTGIDLNGESSSIWWPKSDFTKPYDKSSLAAASFGQTFNITPIQLITAVSACVNGGYLMKPYLVEKTVDSSGAIVTKTEPTVVRQVISEKTSAIVREMMEGVVSDGTGHNAYVAGYRIGGKTGTSTNTTMEAETGKKQYIVSFVGVAPMDDPEIAILVLLDSPSNNTGIYISGGQMGAPTAGKMFADILPYLGYEPEYNETEIDKIDRTVPSLKGMTVDEAAAKLAESGFTYRTIGSGAYVSEQLPAANSVIAANSQVILYCEAAPPENLETMIDLTNLTYSIARQRLGTNALFLKSQVPIINPERAVITWQSVPVGEQIPYGTVIVVAVTDKTDANEY